MIKEEPFKSDISVELLKIEAVFWYLSISDLGEHDVEDNEDNTVLFGDAVVHIEEVDPP